MEERLPTSDAIANDENPPLPLPPPPGRPPLETYVVQIPRDNVCRIPPPDHARIVEEHIRKAAAAKPEVKRRRRRFRCSLALPILLVIVIMAIAILTARAALFRPTPPAFTITRIWAQNLNPPPQGKNSTSAASQRKPEFKMTIKMENQNPWMNPAYRGGGAATLDFKDRRIAQGKIPAYIKVKDDGGADFVVSLAGKGAAALPKDVKTKLNGDQEKFMELSLDMKVEMTSLLRSEDLNLQIYCDFRVRNSLSKNAKIVRQKCGTGYN